MLGKEPFASTILTNYKNANKDPIKNCSAIIQNVKQYQPVPSPRLHPHLYSHRHPCTANQQ